MTLPITHLRRIALRAVEAQASAAFYEEVWGLTPVSTGGPDGPVALRGTGGEHHLLELHQAEINGIEHIGFGMPSADDVDRSARTLGDRGVRILQEPGELTGPGGGYGFRFADLEGRVIECSTLVQAARPTPDGPTPKKLAHVVLNTVDIDAACAWWIDMVGLRVSDWSEHQMVFLRCNDEHHCVAFNQAEHTSLNHVAYEVPSLDGYMRSLGRLKRAGHDPAWGPGRHGPGNNAFGYFIDPSGLVCEVTAEVERIDEATWTPRVWPRTPELSDLWGTAGPPSPLVRSHMAGVPDPTSL
ncbi:MAG: VOC family protein [Actinomycetota bacterium]